MAEILRVHGTTETSQQVGRELEWILVNVTGDMTALVDGPDGSETVLDQVRRVIDTFGSITFVGVATATDVVFGIEGASVLDVEELGKGSETFAAVEASIDSISGLSGTTVSVLTLTGAGLS